MAEVAAGEHAHHGAHGGPKHDYHLVDPSPWPFVGSMSALVLTSAAVMWMHGSTVGGWMLTARLPRRRSTPCSCWFRDVHQGVGAGDYSERVASMLRVGMVLFICSEVLFFFALLLGLLLGRPGCRRS